jgi:hypothetical protein
MQAIAEVLATTEIASSTNSDKDNDSWAGADFSGLDNPEALRRFISVSDYLLHGGNFDNGGYELTWP